MHYCLLVSSNFFFICKNTDFYLSHSYLIIKLDILPLLAPVIVRKTALTSSMLSVPTTFRDLTFIPLTTTIVSARLYAAFQLGHRSPPSWTVCVVPRYRGNGKEGRMCPTKYKTSCIMDAVSRRGKILT